MDESTHNRCIFSDVLDTCSIDKSYANSVLSSARKNTVIAASHQRQDSLHETIEERDQIYHTLCYTAYTSKEKIQRHLKRKSMATILDLPVLTSKRINDMTPFDFTVNCFICGTFCSVEMDTKHPDRWKKNPGMLCKTADRGKGKLSFKEVILNVCDQRGDIEGDNVRIRLQGAQSDLHAAEAR